MLVLQKFNLFIIIAVESLRLGNDTNKYSLFCIILYFVLNNLLSSVNHCTECLIIVLELFLLCVAG